MSASSAGCWRRVVMTASHRQKSSFPLPRAHYSRKYPPRETSIFAPIILIDWLALLHCVRGGPGFEFHPKVEGGVLFNDAVSC